MTAPSVLLLGCGASTHSTTLGFWFAEGAAIRYAPAGSSREAIVGGVGCGIGRVAAHEFAHQILGVSMAHNRADEASYEYDSPDRSAQYYGERRWTIAGPALKRKLGER